MDVIGTTKTLTKPFVLGPGENRWDIAGNGWQIRFTGADTAGALCGGEGSVPPLHAGPPLHVHTNETELFFVLEGILTVQVGEERFEVPAGGLAWLPPGIPHTFANLGDVPVRLSSVFTPAGLEEMFAERRAYFDSIQGSPDWNHVAVIEARHGVRIVGPQIPIPTR